MPGKLIYTKGDLFTSDAHIIAHGCNTKGGFGSGVAGIVSRLYPEVRNAYMSKFHQHGWRLGEVQFVDTDDGRIIANMATQDTYGGPGVHVDYGAVCECFNVLLDHAQKNGLDVAIPKIGAGLAGGDWGKIETIIRDVLVHYDVNVTCYIL